MAWKNLVRKRSSIHGNTACSPEWVAVFIYILWKDKCFKNYNTFKWNFELFKTKSFRSDLRLLNFKVFLSSSVVLTTLRFEASIQTGNHGEGNESNEGDEEERRQKEVCNEKEEVNELFYDWSKIMNLQPKLICDVTRFCWNVQQNAGSESPKFLVEVNRTSSVDNPTQCLRCILAPSQSNVDKSTQCWRSTLENFFY